ncbi:hypothetical protein BH09ACT8_BH09ACT8_32400 [soil metagenome]
MPTKAAVEKLHHLLAELQQCVTALHSTHGDTPPMRRILNDAQQIRNGIHRLEIDAEDLELVSAAVPCARPAEMIQISDTDYDASFWRDVDHEGVGAQSLAGAHAPRKRR